MEAMEILEKLIPIGFYVLISVLTLAYGLFASFWPINDKPVSRTYSAIGLATTASLLVVEYIFLLP